MSAHTPIKVFDENVSHYSGDSKNTIFCHGIKILLILMHSKVSSQVNKHEFVYRQRLLIKISFLQDPLQIHKTTSMWFFQDLLQQHVQNINLFFHPELLLYSHHSPVIQAKTQGSLSTPSSQSCPMSKTYPS